MVCMQVVSTVEIHFIEGTMNANMFCDILKWSMNSFLLMESQCIIPKNDNAIHTSKMTNTLLKKLRLKVIY